MCSYHLHSVHHLFFLNDINIVLKGRSCIEAPTKMLLLVVDVTRNNIINHQTE